MKKKKMEFSKLIVFVFLFIFFWGAIVGTIAVISDVANPNLDYFLIYMGIPASAAVSFYFWKAKNENMIKIDEARKKKKLDQIGTNLLEEDDSSGNG